MKTSNLFFLAAILSLFASALISDLGLRAAYADKSYLDPFKGSNSLNFKDFNSIDVSLCRAGNIKITRGAFSVRVFDWKDKPVKITQDGAVLHIGPAMNGGEPQNLPNKIYISCPALTSVNMTHIPVPETQPDQLPANIADSKLTIRGFRLDTLSLVSDYGTDMILDSNTINYIKADIGHSAGADASLEIRRENIISSAYLNIHRSSHLNLATTIPDLNYTLDDSATISLSGAMAKKLDVKK